MNAPVRHDATLRMIAAFVDDRPQERVFQVDRRLFTDTAVFEAELRHVFESTWNFVGLETQLAHADDFVTTHIGRHPILLTRDRQGTINGFLNTCRHRGTIVCPFKSGRRALHVCRYHGWSYDSAGRNVAIPELEAGQYPEGFAARDHNLLRVAKLGNYRGFIFASLSPDVPALDEYLGETKRFLDLVIDQSPTGQVEFVPGGSTYTFDANWKLQFENGLDYYHFAATHSSYVDILKRRPAHAASKAGLPTEPGADEEGQGSFNFAHGHAVNWSIKNAQLYGRPLSAGEQELAKVQARVGPDRAKWMLRQRNLTIFPNLQVIDILSAQVRTWRPLAPDKTEMVSHCLAPVGEPADLREIRIRNYEDFFNPTGLASSDDNVMYEFCQSGYAAEQAGFTEGYLRGVGASTHGESTHAAELGIGADEWSFGSLGFGGETNFHAGYREWKRLIERAATKSL